MSRERPNLIFECLRCVQEILQEAPRAAVQQAEVNLGKVPAFPYPTITVADRVRALEAAAPCSGRGTASWMEFEEDSSLCAPNSSI